MVRLMRPCSVKFQVIGSVVLLAAGLTGCGGSDEPAAASAATSSAETSAPAAPNVPAAPVDSPAAPAGAPAGPPPDTDSQASGETPGAVGAGMSSSGGPPGGMPMGGPPGGMPMGGPPGGDLAMAGAMSGGAGGMPMGGMGMPGMPGMPGGAAGVPVAARPADLSKWSTKDMKDAVRERDRQVLKVIDQKVKQSPGDPQVAALLMELLAASNEAPVTPAAGNAMPGSFPGAAGGYPGSAGYGSMPGMPGGAGLGGSSLQGGAGYGGGAPLPGDDSGTLVSPAGGGAAPGSGMPPQSSLEQRPVDSLEAMFVESATAWQAQPGVGAMRSGFKVPAPGQAGGTPGAPDDGVVPGGPGMPPGMSGGLGMPGMPAMPGGEMSGGAGAGGQNSPTASATADRELVTAIVNGLIQNGSPDAWQALFAIAAGNAKTPLPLEANAEIVTLALFRQIEADPAQVEQVLLAVIDGSAPLPAESREASLRTIAAVSGKALDRLTGLQNAGVAVTQVGAGSGFGGSSDLPGNTGMPGMEGMAGGLGMAGPPGMPGAPAMGSRPGMAGGPSLAGAPGLAGPPGLAAPPGMAAMAGMAGGRGAPPGMQGPPGMPSMPGAGGFNSSPGAVAATTGSDLSISLPDPIVTKAAAFLWSKPCCDSIATQLRAATDLSLAEPLLALAGSIPSQKVREAAFALFETAHSGGSDTLNNSGFFTSAVHDPGMLVVLKSLPRSKASKGDDGKAPMDSWTVSGQQMVLSYVDQLRTMSMAPGSKLVANTKGFPMRPHRNAEFDFVGMIRVAAPQGAPAESGISETKVYYARASFSPKKPKEQQDVMNHYKSGSNGIQRADDAQGLTWFDGVKAGASGTRRSIDVVVRTGKVAGAAGPGLPGSGGFGGMSEVGGMPGPGGMPGMPGRGGMGGAVGGDYTVEVIIVEVADPKGATESDPATADAAK